MDEIIGREQELGLIDLFVAPGGDRPRSLLLEGEAGSGKTTLWLAGCDAARAAGARVLTARPLEAETGFAFAGIADLLAEATMSIEELPEPQARALRVALLLAPAGDMPADERAVGLGVLGILRRLAADTPVVLAVDDIQWLDAPSARALTFAAHRLGVEAVGLLLALRLEEQSRLVFEPERALPGLRRIRLAPLALEEVHRLVRSRLGRSFSRPTLREIHSTSGGNPLFALELARALENNAPDHQAGERIPVPKSLRDLVGARIVELPEETQQVLLVAAALADPTLDIVLTAAGGEAMPALETAIAAEVVEIDGGPFASPILCSPPPRTKRRGQVAGATRTPSWRVSPASPRSERATSPSPPGDRTQLSPASWTTQRAPRAHGVRRWSRPSSRSSPRT